jgi:hypothetical protein
LSTLLQGIGSTLSQRYLCPKCHSSNGLWEGVEVPGWRSIDEHLQPSGQSILDRGTDWTSVTQTGEVGCGECGWEGLRRDLLKIGFDGEPLPVLHPQQLAIEVS